LRAGQLNAEARLVISNNKDCEALDFARTEGVRWRHISGAVEGGAEKADRAMVRALQVAGAELIVLSGYMRKLGPEMLARYRGRILNIHPSLLPKYGGQGMYGRHVHEAVRASGDALTGASFHLV
jgi:phosphoribosylglycinamide formyltransferase-1